MRDPHRWEHLRPEEFNAELARAPLVYWACGPVEDHGLQNALGLDPCKAYEICLRAAAISGGIVFPMVPFAPAGNPMLGKADLLARSPLFPPSLFASRELCQALYSELFQSLAALRFRACVAFGGHGPAATLLGQVADTLGGVVGGMRIATCGSTTFIQDILAREDKRFSDRQRHGGRWETSMNMALNREYVDLSRVRHIAGSPIPSQLKGLPEAALEAIEHSSVEFGETLLATAAERLAERGLELLAMARSAPVN